MNGILRRWQWIVYSSTLFLLTFASSTWATSASISVSGNEGPIPLQASATFTKYDQNRSGTLYVYDGDHLIKKVTGQGSASWEKTLDGGALSQGEHVFTAKAVDSQGNSHSSSTTILIDNTPTITMNSPGPVEGEFDFGGTATFKERVNGAEGRVRISIGNNEWNKVVGEKWYEGKDVR